MSEYTKYFDENMSFKNEEDNVFVNIINFGTKKALKIDFIVNMFMMENI